MFVSYDKLVQAYEICKSWKKWDSDFLKFEKNEKLNLEKLYQELVDNSYEIWEPIRQIKNIDGNLREIIYLPFRDRIVQQMVWNILYPLVENKSYNDIYGWIKGKGVNYGVKRISRFMRSCSDNYKKDCYILKLDIKSFFLSINKDILRKEVLNLIQEKWKNNKELREITYLLNQVIFKDYRDFKNIAKKSVIKRYPKDKSMTSSDWSYWLPHWNTTSQIFANLYLHKLDVFIKENLWIKYYWRYVDDFILVHEDKEYLKECLKRIKFFLKAELKLTIHPDKIYLQHISKWVKFLGVMIYPYYKTLSKRTIYRWTKKISNINNPKDRKQVFMSYDWLAKHYDNYRLRQKRNKIYNQWL